MAPAGDKCSSTYVHKDTGASKDSLPSLGRTSLLGCCSDVSNPAKTYGGKAFPRSLSFVCVNIVATLQTAVCVRVLQAQRYSCNELLTMPVDRACHR